MMKAERLIDLVRSYNALYDPDDKGYNNHEEKEATWAQIGASIHLPPKECKRLWNNLRDCFRKALKKRKEIQSTHPTRKIKRWKYEDEMTFLVPFMKDKELVKSNDPDQELDEDYEDYACVEEDKNDNWTWVAHKDDEQTNASVQLFGSSSDPPHMRSIMENPETASLVLMKYILSNKSNQENPPNDIDLFFSSMASTVKKFSPYNQAIAKAKVFSAISDLEMTEISQRECTPISAQTILGTNSSTSS